MKAIINGKRYDTETAFLVADNRHGHGRDFRYIEESLYRTSRGSWFLAGKGGPMTKYAKQVDQSSWTGGERIIPLTESEAQEWLESHGKTEVLEQYFGDSISDA